MSDTNDKPLAEDQEQDGSTNRLLQDLKSLPKVSAPLDFEYHLHKKIADLDTAKATPWWKSFFFRREGGLRVPVFAYGGAAAVMILAFAVYVYDVSDFQKNMPLEKRQRVMDAEFKDIPAFDDDQSVLDNADSERKQLSEEEAAEVSAESETGADVGLRVSPKAPVALTPGRQAPSGIEAEHTILSPEERGSSAQEYKRAREAGDKKEQALTPVDEADGTSQTDNLRYAPQPAAKASDNDSEQLKEDAAPKSKGILGKQAIIPIGSDSSAAADSLRRLDSLRSLQQDYKTDPPDDTR